MPGAAQVPGLLRGQETLRPNLPDLFVCFFKNRGGLGKRVLTMPAGIISWVSLHRYRKHRDVCYGREKTGPLEIQVSAMLGPAGVCRLMLRT